MKLRSRPDVEAVMYDVAGRRVRTIHRGPLSPGSQTLFWDGRDESGRSVAKGVYLIRVKTPGQEHVGKVMLLR